MNALQAQGVPLILGTHMKNERPRVREWLAYHAALGFSAAYLVDDAATDGTPEEALRAGQAHSVRVRSMPSTSPACLRERGSEDTEAYRGNTRLALAIIEGFKRILDAVRSDYPNGACLALIDVDEFLFCRDPVNQPAETIRRAHAGIGDLLIPPSYEVDSRTFDPAAGPVTAQSTRSMSSAARRRCTRAEVGKAVLFTDRPAPFFSEPLTRYGAHIHRGGVPDGYHRVAEGYDLAFLHYRKPMYDPEHNGELFDRSYPWVAGVLSGVQL